MASTGLFDDPLELGEKKSHMEHDQVNREVVSVRRCPSRPGMTDVQAVVGRCIVSVKQPRFFLPSVHQSIEAWQRKMEMKDGKVRKTGEGLL